MFQISVLHSNSFPAPLEDIWIPGLIAAMFLIKLPTHQPWAHRHRVCVLTSIKKSSAWLFSGCIQHVHPMLLQSQLKQDPAAEGRWHLVSRPICSLSHKGRREKTSLLLSATNLIDKQQQQPVQAGGENEWILTLYITIHFIVNCPQAWRSHRPVQATGSWDERRQTHTEREGWVVAIRSISHCSQFGQPWVAKFSHRDSGSVWPTWETNTLRSVLSHTHANSPAVPHNKGRKAKKGDPKASAPLPQTLFSESGMILEGVGRA